jgi:hypothetical protein
LLLQCPSFLKKLNPQGLFRFIVVISVPILIILGILWFWQLNISDQVDNLRRLSSTLIQVHATVLVLLITIGLALLSFSAGKYSSRLVRKSWKSRKMSFLFFSMAAPIAICCTILISLSEDLYFSLEILGTSFSMVEFFVVLESSTIFMFILAVYLVLNEIYEAVGGLVDEVLSDLIRDIQTRDNTEEAFWDLFQFLSSLAENKDLTSLRKTMTKLFDLIIEDEENCEIVYDMLYDIYKRYERENEYFCLGVMGRMIEENYRKVLKSGNSILIEKISNFITKIQTKEVYELDQERILCN